MVLMKMETNTGGLSQISVNDDEIMLGVNKQGLIYMRLRIYK